MGRMSVGGSTIILSNLPATEGRVLPYEYLKSGGTVHADPKKSRVEPRLATILYSSSLELRSFSSGLNTFYSVTICELEDDMTEMELG